MSSTHPGKDASIQTETQACNVEYWLSNQTMQRTRRCTYESRSVTASSVLLNSVQVSKNGSEELQKGILEADRRSNRLLHIRVLIEGVTTNQSVPMPRRASIARPKKGHSGISMKKS